MRRFPAPASAGSDYLSRRLRGALRREPAHVGWVARPDFLAELDAQLAAFSPDVVHLFGWGTAQLAQRVSPVPTTHFAIDPWADAIGNRVHDGRLGQVRAITDLGERSAAAHHERTHYPRCGAVCFVSGGEVELMRERIPTARFETVPLGVDVPELASSTAEPVIALHGAMDVLSNRVAAVDLVREVLPRIQRDVPDASVVLIGRDPALEVRALTGDHVIVAGSVPSMPDALRQAAIAVAPMSVGTGMKNKVLEAMAVGLPVVTTPAGLSGIGDGPGVLVGHDFAALAAHAVTLLTDPQLRATMGADARARVRQDFSWQASAARLEALWEQLQR